MTPEQERRLYEVLEGISRIETALGGLSDRFSEHEDADAKAHGRIGKLETNQTRLFAYWAAALVIVPAAIWVLNALGKASAQ